MSIEYAYLKLDYNLDNIRLNVLTHVSVIVYVQLTGINNTRLYFSKLCKDSGSLLYG